MDLGLGLPWALRPERLHRAGFLLGHPECFTRSVVKMPMPRQVGVDLALDAPISAVRAKSLALGDLLIRLINQRCPAGHVLRLVSPADPAQRGSQLCFSHPEAYGIVQARCRQAPVHSPPSASAASSLRLAAPIEQPLHPSV